MIVWVILCFGGFELFKCDDVLVKVVIDEYVEIVNVFFDGSELKFVNVVLDKCGCKVCVLEF